MTDFTELLYEKLNSLFGTGEGSLFQMEMPARLLEKGNYDYKGSDTIDAQQVKPQTVVDAEFRLADDMYNISRTIAGPNAMKVSSQYSSVINGLVPTSSEEAKHSKELVDDQERICEWLMEMVPDWTPPVTDILRDIPSEYSESKPAKIAGVKIDDNVASLDISAGTFKASELIKMEMPGTTNIARLATTKLVPRVDLYQKLLDAYEAERFRWADFKRKSRPTCDNATPENIDNYNRMLAAFAPIVDAKLEGMWTMLVVRGQYHRVRRYIGYVDIESASELVQKAKENLRASMFRSIDDTQDVWPVYMQPSNWATYLSTKFKPQDLLCDEGVLRARLFDKEKEKALLLQKRNALKSNTAEIDRLQKEELEARKVFTNAQTALTKGYSDTAINIISMYFDCVTKQATNKVDAVLKLSQDANAQESSDQLSLALKQATSPPISKEQFQELARMQGNVLKTQQDALTSSEALSRASLGLALAKGQDPSALMAALDMQIESLGLDINYMKQTLKGSANPLGIELQTIGADGELNSVEGGSKVKAPTQLEIPVQEEGASVWQEVVLSHKFSQSSSSSSSSASTSRSSYEVGWWFGSSSGTSESTTGSSGSENRSSEVVINRPWMNPGIFQRLQEFYFESSGKIAPTDPAKVKAALSPAKVGDSDDQTRKSTIKEAQNTILPTWPVSFIVAKDVHILMSGGKHYDTNQVSDMQRKMDSGGGCLCFSTSKSEASSEHRTAAATSFEADRLSIKIPAPQIIGWVSNFCAPDLTQARYNPLEQKEFQSINQEKLSSTLPSSSLPESRMLEPKPVSPPGSFLGAQPPLARVAA
ncbi:hypothetical protein T440DRAFT_504053 [Plenodomus tracheiphilus IPT5]|uniref:Uncharacterized protein n=1 Tax=Plenodomus tracheiphilus IPT5 TaxID=1408161 RepID=A0A6A7BIS1_9PLEO|nr:hypothetical protein T440DRAFT_504053 [Plenodomus tracheiphilus IPT5]